MNELTFIESMDIPDRVYIDVRSPGEFAADHVAGSVNIPLFDDAERKEVGTIYRLGGREDAIVRGTAIVGGKLSGLVGAFMAYRDRTIVIMCARGGMRSTSLVSLLASLGLNVFKLRDGYKGYRRYVREELGALGPGAPLFVLQGLTGAGKTEIIRRMPHAVDLEEMAGHRSSVFGGIGRAQNSQKRFESLLVDRLRALARGGAPCMVVEGESRKIGNLHLPGTFYGIMRRSPAILIDTPLERRVEIIYNEYHAHCDDENIPAIVRGLESRLGGKNVGRLIALYRAGDIREFIRVMLLTYYDPLYRHTLEHRDYIATIQNLDTSRAVKEVRGSIEEYLHGGKFMVHAEHGATPSRAK
jgi:tRNA 2-selenouridine synthase